MHWVTFYVVIYKFHQMKKSVNMYSLHIQYRQLHDNTLSAVLIFPYRIPNSMAVWLSVPQAATFHKVHLVMQHSQLWDVQDY